MRLWRAACCLSQRLGDLGAINEAVFYLYKVLSVPSAVQMIVLDVVLLPYCFRATPTFFPVKPKQNRGCVSLQLQTWQLWGSSLAHFLEWWKEQAQIRPPFLTVHSGLGEGSWEGQLPPALPSPCCSLAPCWGLWARAKMLQCRCPVLPGSSCPSKLARNFPASVREKIPVSGSESSNLRLCCLFFVQSLCVVPVPWDDGTLSCWCWGEFDFDWKCWWGVSCGAQDCSSSRGCGVTCLQCTGLRL